jgi:hypothetical protein
MRMTYCSAILLVLAGCAGQDQIVAHQTGQQIAQQTTASRGQIAARQAAREAALNRADDARCQQSRGAPGSSAYLACRVKLASNRPAADVQAATNN